MSLNKWIGIGNLVKDPEAKYTPSGKSVCNFTIAVGNSEKQADGSYGADFIKCICWEKTADNMMKYCQKGTHVAVEGTLRIRSYDNNEGGKNWITEIQYCNVTYLSRTIEQGESSSEPTPKPTKKVSAPAEDDDFADADPFADE
jgi:single-strand DNA-binding protein